MPNFFLTLVMSLTLSHAIEHSHLKYPAVGSNPLLESNVDDLSIPDFFNMKPERITTCKINGCTRRGTTDKNGTEVFSLGYCVSHYKKFKLYGDPFAGHYKNGKSKHELRDVYNHMISRCHNPKDKQYVDYGVRGVKVCDRWQGIEGFTNFIHDMVERPEGYSIDREDNDGGYNPFNCRWADKYQQANNRRNNNLENGVYFDYTRWKWCAALSVDKKKHFKRFDTKEDAVNYRQELLIKFNIQLT